MKHLPFFLLFFFTSFCGFGQEPSRCATQFPTHSPQFETWLQSKASSLRLSDETVYKIPVVVHILHLGEPVGQGSNLPEELVHSQIRILNEDFRRKEGTNGHNTHPAGGDARIEFVLAKSDPNGAATDGIVRVNATNAPTVPGDATINDRQAFYSYWDPEKYLNIWSTPDYQINKFLGYSKFPVTGLPGFDWEDDAHADGVTVNCYHFGKIATSNYDLGRTATHEIGHYLGLFHVWGKGGSGSQSCGEATDYCEDTPPVTRSTSGCPASSPLACNGQPAMIQNYMDYSHDRCMNIFTQNQIARMHTVLNNSPRRKSLLSSPGLLDPDQLSLASEVEQLRVKVLPDEILLEHTLLVGGHWQLEMYTLSGQKVNIIATQPQAGLISLQLEHQDQLCLIRLSVGNKSFNSKVLLASPNAAGVGATK